MNPMTDKEEIKRGRVGAFHEDGPFEWFYDNGQLMTRENYKDDKLDGLRERFYDNGQSETRGNLKDNEKFGLWESFYDNGQLRDRRHN